MQFTTIIYLIVLTTVTARSSDNATHVSDEDISAELTLPTRSFVNVMRSLDITHNLLQTATINDFAFLERTALVSYLQFGINNNKFTLEPGSAFASRFNC